MNNRPGKPPVEELDLDTLELVAGGFGSGGEKDGADGTVVELLPNAMFSVDVGGQLVTAHENELRQNRGWRPGSGGGQPDHVEIQEESLKPQKRSLPEKDERFLIGKN